MKAPCSTSSTSSTPLSILLALLALALVACGDGGPAPAGAPQENATARSRDLADPVWAPGPPGIGYTPRACGFDMDDDGVVGESADCRVCNGRDRDPDGDGVEEDQIYVDAAGGGQDLRGCGTPAQPCASLGYALTQVADGRDDGAEDIFCLYGRTTEENLKPISSGLEGAYDRPASGSQERAFSRRRDPAMLVGWDHDGDGQYPPFDREDVAVVVGTGKARALVLDSVNDGFEVAHLSFVGFGQDNGLKSTGFVKFGPSPGELEHVYFHDLHLVDINRGRETASETATFDLFLGKTRLRHLEVDNVWAPRNGGFFARGAAADQGPDSGPYRFQRIGYTGEACNFADCQTGATVIGFHLWGYVSGIEILDSYFDANVKNWEPKPKGGPTGAGFVTTAQCSQDWLIRNNLAVDYKVFAKFQGWAEGYCDKGAARPVDRVVVDRNSLQNQYEPWTGGDLPFFVSEGGPNAGEVVGNLWITNNVLTSSTGYEACFWLLGGNGAATPPGEIVYAHNTCAVNINRHAAVVIGNAEGKTLAKPHERVLIFNNLTTGLGNNDLNLHAFYRPADSLIDHNAWDVAGQFDRLGERATDLAAWQKLSGWDLGSVTCTPSFVEIERQNLRLKPDDTCVRGKALDPRTSPTLERLLQVDRDGQKRPKPAAIGAY